jgi:hypothetical protein
MAQSARALQAYRVILRTIRTVFEDDIRMQTVGNHQARVYFEKYRSIVDPKKIDYLIKEAYEARDTLYRDVLKLDYSAQKGRHVGVIEKRHLKFEDGTEVYQTPTSGRGLGVRNNNNNNSVGQNQAVEQAAQIDSAAQGMAAPVKKGLKITSHTTAPVDV